MDEFEINVIDLRDDNIWRYQYDQEDDEPFNINCIKDFINLQIMIDNSTKTKILIILPMNLNFYFNYYRGAYIHSDELKNITYDLDCILARLISSEAINLLYENTKTDINKESIAASFYFKSECNGTLTHSDGSNKPTTIRLNDNLLLTTLDLNISKIDDFFRVVGLINERENIPLWVKELHMFDDQEQKNVIDSNNKVINESNNNIIEASKVIEKNNELKSILCSSGDDLVRTVFEILEDMFKCNLADFEDKKQEDFLIELEGKTFIGEIKGVNHNVKSDNITQLDVHYQSYLEENPDKSEVNVKALLIIAHQRNKLLSTREPIHKKQIALAGRNGSLIVETITLLKIYEKYKKGNISPDDCIKLFSENIGLLEYND